MFQITVPSLNITKMIISTPLSQVSRLIFAGFMAIGSMTGTTLVMVVMRDKILVGADSKLTVVEADGRVNTETSCKILQSSACFVGVAGLYGLRNRIDFRELARQACNSGPTGQVSFKAHDFERSILDQLPAVVEASKNKPGEILAAFVGQASGRAQFAVKTFHVSAAHDVTSDPIEFGDTSRIKKDKIFALFYYGSVTERVPKYIESIGLLPKRERHKIIRTSLIKRLIDMEIEAAPTLVGPPISILEITNTGRPRWISQGACPAIEH